MSLDAVLSRIDQIISLQQGLLDPSSLAASASASASGGVVTGEAGSSSFADALSAAQASDVATSPVAAGDAPAAVQAMTTMANSLVGKPYVYGGGHAGWGPSAGYDCSGFVSAVLHAGGYLSQPADTTTLPDQPGILSGPGQYVTIYDRDGSGQNGHVIIEINGQFYESGGEAGSWGGGGGVEKINTPSAAYLATFDRVLHPAGL